MNRNSIKMSERFMRRYMASAAILSTMVEKFETEDAIILLGHVAGERLRKDCPDAYDRLLYAQQLSATALVASGAVDKEKKQEE